MTGRLLSYIQGDDLAVGQSTFSRRLIGTGAATIGTGALRLCYFTSWKDEVVTQTRVTSGSTAAGATPTLIRMGLYLIAENGNGTLVAATPNDTTLLAASLTVYTKAFSAPYRMLRGQRYAHALVVVTAATAPTMAGAGVIAVAEGNMAPKINGVIGGQTDLPASFTDVQVTGSGSAHYAAILP